MIIPFLRVLAFGAGAFTVVYTVNSAVRTLVLPRAVSDRVTRTAFRLTRRFFDLRLRKAQTYMDRDHIMALYAPVSLLMLLPIWLSLVFLGFMALFWSVGGADSLHELFLLSGSSLFTLGFAMVHTWPQMILAFSEAAVGLILVALLIAHLPTMYSSFSRREVAVGKLAVRAGSPPSAQEMLLRFHRIGKLDSLAEFWAEWETTFAEIEESHTSLPALVFFRSQQPDLSWLTAAGTVMDAAAIMLSAVDAPNEPSAALCIRAGYLALQRVAIFFGVVFEPTPTFPAHPISISRGEFDAMCLTLAEQGVPLKANMEQAWRDFGGWRVNYDVVLTRLCTITMAPYAPWSSDRSALEDVRKPR
ncbi:MAG: hypothetical protein R2911_17195 [Caldilineaceae bacterium]